MILGSLSNTQEIEKLHPDYKHVFEYIKQNDFDKMIARDEKIEIDSDNIFFFVKEISGVEHEQSKLESHKQYVDIHVPIRGFEVFGWIDRNDCTNPTHKYDSTNDVEFYNDPVSTYFMVSVGDFVLFQPDDVHATGIGYGKIKKAIFKVKIKTINR